MDAPARLAELYDATYLRLVESLHAVGGDQAAAEAAVQAAFARALGRRRSVLGLDDPEAWLRATALDELTRSHGHRMLVPDTLELPLRPPPLDELADAERRRRRHRHRRLATLAACLAGVAVGVGLVGTGGDERDADARPGHREAPVDPAPDEGPHEGLRRPLVLGPGVEASHAIGAWWFAYTDDGPALVDGHGRRRPVTYGAPVDLRFVAGPLVDSRQGLASVDLGTGTLRPLRGEGTWSWRHAGDSWFWGTAVLRRDGRPVEAAAVWRGPDGDFASAPLPAGPGRSLRTGRAGTMAVLGSVGDVRVLQVSPDLGATWQVRRVPAGARPGARLPAGWGRWPLA